MAQSFAGGATGPNNDIDDYMRSCRDPGPWPLDAALSVGVSDMSGWILMCLLGALYASGLTVIHTLIGKGPLAVSYADFIQGFMTIMARVMEPVVGVRKLERPTKAIDTVAREQSDTILALGGARLDRFRSCLRADRPEQPILKRTVHPPRVVAGTVASATASQWKLAALPETADAATRVGC